MADQKPIDDALLGKFLAGETDPTESARVRQWLASRALGSSELSHDDFARFERIWEAAQSDPPTVDPDAAGRSVRKKMRTTDRESIPRSESIIKPQPVLTRESNAGWNQTLFRLTALLTLVAGMGWLVYQFRFMGRDYAARHLVTLTTNDQEIGKTLPDGTRILLNRHSTLQYPNAFSDDHREVTLTGEAYFDVTPDAARPFRVLARPAVVQGQGTSFSVRAYDTANVSVAVRTGKVQFSSGSKVVLLTQNQQATFDAAAGTMR